MLRQTPVPSPAWSRRPQRAAAPPAYWSSATARPPSAVPPAAHRPVAGGALQQKATPPRRSIDPPPVRAPAASAGRAAPPPVHWPGSGAAGAQAKAAGGTAPGALPGARSGRAAVIQRHIIFNPVTSSIESNGKRPGTHLSQPTLLAIVKDLLKNGARNQAELDFEKTIKSIATTNGLGVVWGNAQSVVNVMTSYNVLSNYGFAVCHKVPYSAFEKLLLDSILGFIGKTLGTSEEKALKDLLDGSIGNHDDWNRLKKWKDVYDIEHYARKLCDAFDANPDNLYIGYKSTNSSVGDSADLHWNSLAVGNATASPRGEDLLDLTQKGEQAIFGSQHTTSYSVTDASGTWVLYSGVYGTKNQNTGFVLT